MPASPKAISKAHIQRRCYGDYKDRDEECKRRRGHARLPNGIAPVPRLKRDGSQLNRVIPYRRHGTRLAGPWEIRVGKRGRNLGVFSEEPALQMRTRGTIQVFRPATKGSEFRLRLL